MVVKKAIKNNADSNIIGRVAVHDQAGPTQWRHRNYAKTVGHTWNPCLFGPTKRPVQTRIYLTGKIIINIILLFVVLLKFKFSWLYLFLLLSIV